MTHARTVLGDVPVDQLGAVDAHEHLMIIGGPATRSDPDLRLDDVEDAIAEAKGFASAGGGTIVDAMPTGCGRDAAGLAQVAQATGLNVIATAGFHRPRYYDDLHWARRYPTELLAKVVTAEVESGFDRWDLAGPEVERLPYRPGILKAATGYHSVDEIEYRMLTAVAMVHEASGLPILTHAEHGTHADRQLEILQAEGVEPSSVAISHMDRNPDFGLHRELIERGAFLIYDGLFRERYRPVSAVADVLTRIGESGLTGNIMLGGDVGRRSMRRSGGAPGIAALLLELAPQLVRMGVSESVVQAALVDNPARFLALG